MWSKPLKVACRSDTHCSGSTVSGSLPRVDSLATIAWSSVAKLVCRVARLSAKLVCRVARLSPPRAVACASGAVSCARVQLRSDYVCRDGQRLYGGSLQYRLLQATAYRLRECVRECSVLFVKVDGVDSTAQPTVCLRIGCHILSPMRSPDRDTPSRLKPGRLAR